MRLPKKCLSRIAESLSRQPRPGIEPVDPRPRPTGLGVRVFDECRAGAVTVDRVALGLDIGVADAAMALARLERDGWVRHVAGWFEVTGEGTAG